MASRGRRPAGDGSVYRTRDGRWRDVVDLGRDADGRRRKYVSGSTQAQALEWTAYVTLDTPVRSETNVVSPNGARAYGDIVAHR